MKLLKFEDYGEDKIISLIFDDGTFATTSVSNKDRDKNDLIKDAYILLKNTNREPYDGDTSELQDIRLEEPKATSMVPDFYALNGAVYDQYGDAMGASINYSIEGTDKARIENGTIIEEKVEEDTKYVIKATAGDLIETLERTIYKEEPRGMTTQELEERLSATEQAMADMMLLMGGME